LTEDTLRNFAAAGLDIAIMALICFSLFSGKPAFEISRTTAIGPALVSCEP
jgi:hypothetical protein